MNDDSRTKFCPVAKEVLYDFVRQGKGFYSYFRGRMAKRFGMGTVQSFALVVALVERGTPTPRLLHPPMENLRDGPIKKAAHEIKD